MLFNSIEFIFFLPLVYTLYWFVTNKNLKNQNLLIVIASYIFYGWWDWRFLSLIIFSTVSDYSVGYLLSKTDTKTKRKFLLWVSLLTNLVILGFFKHHPLYLIAEITFLDSYILNAFLDILLLLNWALLL